MGKLKCLIEVQYSDFKHPIVIDHIFTYYSMIRNDEIDETSIVLDLNDFCIRIDIGGITISNETDDKVVILSKPYNDIKTYQTLHNGHDSKYVINNKLAIVNVFNSFMDSIGNVNDDDMIKVIEEHIKKY